MLVQLNKRALCRPRYYQPKYHEIYGQRLACTERYHLHVRRSSAILHLSFFFSPFSPLSSCSLSLSLSLSVSPERGASYTRGRCAPIKKKEIEAPVSRGTIRPGRAPIIRDTSATVFGMLCEIVGKNQYGRALHSINHWPRKTPRLSPIPSISAFNSQTSTCLSKFYSFIMRIYTYWSNHTLRIHNSL